MCYKIVVSEERTCICRLGTMIFLWDKFLSNINNNDKCSLFRIFGSIAILENMSLFSWSFLKDFCFLVFMLFNSVSLF